MFIALAIVCTIAPASSQAALYAPGATLDPACAPTDSNCGVSAAVASGTANSIPYYAADGSTLSATSSLTILPSGNIGIGTLTPDAKLTVETSTPSPTGSELITNGAFTGSAAGWTLGSNVVYGTNNVVSTYAGGDPTAVTTFTSVSGNWYSLTFTVSNANVPLYYYLYDNTWAYYDSSALFTNGTHTIVFQAGYTGTINIVFDDSSYTTGNTWTLDDVSIKQTTLPLPALKVVGYDGSTLLSLGNDRYGNIALGKSAFSSNTTGSYNTASGAYSLSNNSTGGYNTAAGYYAGVSNTAGSNNTFLGTNAGYTDGVVTTAGTLTNATAIGYNSQVTASNSLILGGIGANAVNVGIGTTAPTKTLSIGGTTAQTIWMERNTIAAMGGQGLTLSSGGAIPGTADLAGGDLTLESGISTGLGTSALHFLTATAGLTGTSDNYPTEKMTILGNGNVGIGTTWPSQKLDVSGNVNISLGATYMLNGVNVIAAQLGADNYFIGNAGNLTMTGVNNTATGWQALYSNTIGNQNTANGSHALYSNTTGTFNVAVGSQAGKFAGGSIANATSSNSVYIGAATMALASGDTGEIVIGANAVGKGSGTAVLGTSGAYLTAGGVWTNASDRNLKTNFTSLDQQSILGKIATLPITEWNYKAESATTTHIGPMAQDFYAAFGLGGSAGETSISTIDPAGVALLGIQALDQRTSLMQDVLAISGAFKDTLVSWLGDATNGIGKVFATVIEGNTLRADNQLCVGSTCITESDLKALLQKNNQAPTGARRAISNAPVGHDTTGDIASTTATSTGSGATSTDSADSFTAPEIVAPASATSHAETTSTSSASTTSQS